MKYIIARFSFYDDEELLWFTKVGLVNEEMDLLYVVAGKTVKESRKRAIELVELLNNRVSM